MKILRTIGSLINLALHLIGLSKENPLRLFSFGGGVQSTAVLVLQAMGKLKVPYHAFVFCNVGDDSENPDTLVYVREHVIPFCQKHGIPFFEVQKTRFGVVDTLLQALYRDNRSVSIPAYMSFSGAPGNRTCTEDHKIVVVDKLVKWFKIVRWCVIGLGISVDEMKRLKDTDWHDSYTGPKAKKAKKIGFNKRRDYPLVDLRLSRQNCQRIIEDAGLPPAPKSSCWFCPFMKLSQRIEQKRNRPDLFQASVNVEKRINEKRAILGKDELFLVKSPKGVLVPLDQAVGDQLPMFLDDTGIDDSCDEGVCMT